MATQDERQDFIFPPNENSAQTNLRYDLTAEKWTRAFNSAQISTSSTSFGGSISFIVTLIKFVFNIVLFVVVLIVDFIKWFRSKKFI